MKYLFLFLAMFAAFNIGAQDTITTVNEAVAQGAADLQQFKITKLSLLAYGLAMVIMVVGFYLLTAFNYLQKGKFEKTFTRERLIITFSLMAVFGWILVYQPDLAEALKSVTGLDANIDDSKAGFLTLGFALNKLLSQKIVEETESEDIK